MKWDISKYILQILRASLAVASMAVFLRAEDLHRTLHNFQSGVLLSSAKDLPLETLEFGSLSALAVLLYYSASDAWTTAYAPPPPYSCSPKTIQRYISLLSSTNSDLEKFRNLIRNRPVDLQLLLLMN